MPTTDFTRRRFLAAGSALTAATATAHAAHAAPADDAVPLELPGLQAGAPWRVAFGSCARQDKPQPIWRAVTAAEPHLFMFIGDNLYADAESAPTLRERYAAFHQAQALQQFRRSHAHIAMWDDHDYGDDDAGGDYPYKRLSQQLFCDEWGEAPDSPRRRRSGVYQAWRVACGGRVLQVLMPDLRFNRTPLLADPARRLGYRALMAGVAAGRREPVPGWYRPNPDPAASLLGAEQWAWLERQLAQPADLRLLVSTVQFAAEGTGWEGWANFPLERQRLFDLIRRHRAEGIVIVSGDMHYGELSRMDVPGLYPLWDLTSSGLTEVWDVPTPNTRRASAVVAEPNFGLIEIDWQASRVALSVRGVDGGARLAHTLAMS
ncbi:MAG: alkaline phosphatase family protein, partial [Burkholderiales bacterium]|nr:alkaline phosphatase family protein [Burkholderiales bacterium]